MLLRADKIHDGKKWLPEDTILEVSSNGVILNLHTPKSSIPLDNINYYQGILCPGFINAHCHTELSHLYQSIPQHTGLISFITQIVQKRKLSTIDTINNAIFNAVEEMKNDGIVAIGDIANTTDSLHFRADSSLHWFTFIEAIGFNPENALINFEAAYRVCEKYQQQGLHLDHLQQSIVPHAPYSVSVDLLKKIVSDQANKILSIHNQETEEEDVFFKTKSGRFVDFYKEMNINISHFNATYKSSVQSLLPYFATLQKTIFVHNTFTQKSDITLAIQNLNNPYFCFCPNANLYIENKLPNIQLFIEQGANICLGTDSLASNHQLSIMAEMVCIQKYFPEITWEQLIQWACYNGASALGLEKKLGLFEIGKKPGIVWINNNFTSKKII